jgi:prevent-host-death family protein
VKSETLNVYVAKAQLSSLIERALVGEHIILSKRGKPLVQLVPLQQPKPKRKLGFVPADIQPDFEARSMEKLDLKW